MQNLLQNARTIQTVTLTDCRITLAEFMAVVRYGAQLHFSDAFCRTVNESRALLDRFLAEGRIIYGVTTGFGENVRYTIPPAEAAQLQLNIVRSHACAVGQPLPQEQARAVMLQTILNDGKGASGLRLETLSLIRDMLNLGITPYAPGEGSVGYLGVEGHFAMAYIGEGAALTADGKATPILPVLQQHGLSPVSLQCKEGLSLLNGTITPTALALVALYDAIGVTKSAEIACALCYEALRGTTHALDPRLHANKQHAEQQNAAANLLRLLEGSQIMAQYRDTKVQDSYVLRSMPQVLGAGRRLVKEAHTAIIEEMHSVSDNPQIFPTEDGAGTALMSANFDGSYVGTHADILSMAAAITGKLVERNINRLTDRNVNDGLPAFLVANPGLNNGLMIPQYTAAGLMNEIKLLAVPASTDSIPTCAGQEDPVSMAYNAAKQAAECQRKLEYVVAIALLTATQAIDLLPDRLPLGKGTACAYDAIRSRVAFIAEDRFLYPDIEALKELVHSGDLVCTVEEAVGTLEF